MIKLIIFDLDGVLIESKDWHFITLNKALSLIDPIYEISYEDHLHSFDGLTTNTKLLKLEKERGLDKKFHKEIWENKQRFTLHMLDNIKSDDNLIEIFSLLPYNLHIASNSIRDTVEKSLSRLGIINYVDFFVSNDDVTYSKPYPEMYWKCMLNCGVLPEETLILEDSDVGKLGAKRSGAHLLEIGSPVDVSYKNIMNKIMEIDN